MKVEKQKQKQKQKRTVNAKRERVAGEAVLAQRKQRRADSSCGALLTVLPLHLTREQSSEGREVAGPQVLRSSGPQALSSPQAQE